MIKPITLGGFRIKKNYEESEFQRLYEILFCGDSVSLTNEEKVKLLKWAVFFFNRGDDGVKRLGYRIIVRYANVFKDYTPLYDISLNAGFIPVSRFIEKNFFNDNEAEKSFLKNFLFAYKTYFKDGNKYLSVEQKRLLDFSKSVITDSLVVAPTSYGKSEMMISKAADNLDKKVCLVVPSKALLAQTKWRLLENDAVATTAKRVLTHPEMFRQGEKAEKKLVAVLTQERLFRLIQKDPNFSLDVLLVDEAHNLLSADERGALLLQVLLILKHRNPNMELKFYTPFIAAAESLQSPYADYTLKAAQVKEFIKIEKYFIYDVKGTKDFSFYDQFMDRHIPIKPQSLNELEFIQAHKAEKNIIYLNKPRDVEAAAASISNMSEEIDIASDAPDVFQDFYKAISEFLHPDYKLLGCLKKGVIYHHGKMPEIIRLYIEAIFSKHPKFSFVVTSSTLLEGVNIPAEKMFLLSAKRGRSLLSRASFKNLTGRVCRFSEIFSDKTGDLRMLEPEVYVINGSYAAKNFAPYNFLSDRAKIKSYDQDEVKNLLLKDISDDEAELLQVKAALEYIENIEEGVIDISLEEKGIDEIRYVTSDIAKACFKNNIHDFDIHINEETLLKNFQTFKHTDAISEADVLLEAIYEIFLKDIKLMEEDGEFARLAHDAARKFYSMFLGWKMGGAPYNQMIQSFLRYWKGLEEKANSNETIPVYVGHSWGEIKRFENEHRPRHVDLRKKDVKQRINIAIIRIKEEQDFIDYNLMKYIDVLHDLELVESNFYDRVKYGSSDQKVICLLKNGISMELAKCLLSGKYNNFLQFNLAGDEINIQKTILDAMAVNNENKVLIFELQFHVV